MYCIYEKKSQVFFKKQLLAWARAICGRFGRKQKYRSTRGPIPSNLDHDKLRRYKEFILGLIPKQFFSYRIKAVLKAQLYLNFQLTEPAKQKIPNVNKSQIFPLHEKT